MISKLRQLPLLAACSDEDLQRVRRLGPVRSVRAGDVVIAEGSAGRESYLVISGQAVMTRAATVLARVGPGAILGERAALVGEAHATTVVADTPLELLTMTPRALWELLSCPGVGWKLLRDREASR